MDLDRCIDDDSSNFFCASRNGTVRCFFHLRALCVFVVQFPFIAPRRWRLLGVRR
jgi:hypothetical protein